MGPPFVSVVTPFYNTAPYLAECIESVLAQTHPLFEYLLVNNCSTDGSREIAARYAARDARIRLIDNRSFVGQVENYNGALARIDPSARYVKMVQADDYLFPECLARMVEVAEREPAVGLVSSYRLQGRQRTGLGLPAPVSRVGGREACRRMLLADCFLLGSPTTVLYRADIVRARQPFFAPGRYHEDTEAGYEILLEHDLGFVHEVLSFSRMENVSITTSDSDLNSPWLDYFIVLERYGTRVLSVEELAQRRREFHRAYFGFLARAVLRLRGRRFWEYHRRGLETVGWKLRWRDFVPLIGPEAARLVLGPRDTLARTVADLRARLKKRTEAPR